MLNYYLIKIRAIQISDLNAWLEMDINYIILNALTGQY